ncbi:MAG: ribosome maturation factor RimM [Betaproteobacteria bacterium]|nr:MAG: ribosome maturation factor RimM [Betaproteobacteria bacterium]
MIVMGRVSAPFGVKGWVKVQPFTEKTDSLLRYTAWWLCEAGKWQRRTIEEKVVHGGSLLVRFAGIADRDRAAALKGQNVAIAREQLPATGEGEYYWADLIGLEVENAAGQSLGCVERLFESGADPVLVVVGEKERLLPFVGAVIKRVDLETRKLLVDWELDY